MNPWTGTGDIYGVLARRLMESLPELGRFIEDELKPKGTELAKEVLVAAFRTADSIPPLSEFIRDARVRVCGRTPLPGDVVGQQDFPWAAHRHYGVMASCQRVVWFDEGSGRIVEDTLEAFLEGNPVFVVDFNEWGMGNMESLLSLAQDEVPWFEERFDADEVVGRARMWLGKAASEETPWTSCDEFAFWCRLGIAERDQRGTEGSFRRPAHLYGE